MIEPSAIWSWIQVISTSKYFTLNWLISLAIISIVVLLSSYIVIGNFESNPISISDTYLDKLKESNTFFGYKSSLIPYFIASMALISDSKVPPTHTHFILPTFQEKGLHLWRRHGSKLTVEHRHHWDGWHLRNPRPPVFHQRNIWHRAGEMDQDWIRKKLARRCVAYEMSYLMVCWIQMRRPTADL